MDTLSILTVFRKRSIVEKLLLLVLFLTIFSYDEVDAQSQHEYLGFNVTSEPARDFALCGTSIQGCLSLSDQNILLASAQWTTDGLDTNAPKWIYERGFLKKIVVGQDILCLAADNAHEGGKVLSIHQHTYNLRLRSCSSDEGGNARHLRFLLLQNGRVQSLASVVGTADDEEEPPSSFCMTLPKQNAGSYDNPASIHDLFSFVKLEPCVDSDSTHQQGMQAYGYREPFLFSLETAWWYPNMIELAFDTGNEMVPFHTDVLAAIQIHDINKGGAMLASLQVEEPAGILKWNASQFLGDYSQHGFVANLVLISKTNTNETARQLDSIQFTVSTSFHSHGNKLFLDDKESKLMFVLVIVSVCFCLITTNLMVAALVTRRVAQSPSQVGQNNADGSTVKLEDDEEDSDEENDLHRENGTNSDYVVDECNDNDESVILHEE